MHVFEVIRTHPSATLPEKSLENSEGFNLYYAGTTRLLIRSHGEYTVIPTGLIIRPRNPEHHLALLILPRRGYSSFYAEHGHDLELIPSLYEFSFEKELQIQYRNFSPHEYKIPPGAYIAQAIVIPYYNPTFVEVKNFGDTRDYT